MSATEATIAVEPPEPAEAESVDAESVDCAAVETMADVIERLGGIPAERIMMRPVPGTATEEDVVRFRLCELIDGTIVRKPVGFNESVWGLFIAQKLGIYANEHDLGFLSGSDSLTRVAPGQVREPDVSFFRWERFPDEKIPQVSIVDRAPDLAIEVLSRGNTKREIDRKRRELFAAGTRLMWIMNPRKKTVEVWTDVETCRALTEDGVLDGGDVLPGFSMPARDWFEGPRRGPKRHG
jgi:Uma2 family endonuclease